MSSEILWVETSLLPLVKPLADRGQGHHGPVGWALQIIQQDPRNLTKRSFKKRVFCQNDLRIYPGKCICWLATLLSAPMNSAEREAVSFESDNDTQYTRVVLLPRWTAETGMTFDTTQWALIPFQKMKHFCCNISFLSSVEEGGSFFGGKKSSNEWVGHKKGLLFWALIGGVGLLLNGKVVSWHPASCNNRST